MPTTDTPALRRMFSPPLRVELVGDEGRGPRYLGYAANLSATGAFLQCTSPRSAGTRLMLKIHSGAASARPVYAEVEVRWQRGYAGKLGASPGMGVQFVEMRDRERQLLSRWLCANELQAGPASQRPEPGGA